MLRPYACRICSSPDHELILSFGDVALADSFLSDSSSLEEEPRFPLNLVICKECNHVQIKEVLDPGLMFRDYPWETGIPSSIRPYCREFADSVIPRLTSRTPRVLEVASNDGTMLSEFQSRGCTVLGVDPASNIVRKANERGVATLDSFFDASVATSIRIQHCSWDLIIARNVLAHVADLQGLVAGIKLLLAEDGLCIVEVPQLLTMYQELQYDQVFHEHVGYHSLDSIVRLFSMHGLRVIDVEDVWIHGGSIRATICHQAAVHLPSPGLEEALKREIEAGILDPECWRSFGDRARTQKSLLRELLSGIVAQGKVVAGYGASGKGQTMLQFCELNRDMVAFIADKSKEKIGKLTPGTHIPVVSPEEMRVAGVDYLVLFAWNFADEIIKQEQALVDQGVRFIHPLPHPHYLDH